MARRYPKMHVIDGVVTRRICTKQRANAKTTTAQSRPVANRAQGGGAARLAAGARARQLDACDPAPLSAMGDRLDRLPRARIRDRSGSGCARLVDQGGLVRGGSQPLSRRTSGLGRCHRGGAGARGAFEYRYDMGDGWAHRIVIESAPPSAAGEFPLPLCVAGENACPPEDVGGSHGYAEFLRALGERRHEQHEDMARWIGVCSTPRGLI